jgi:flavin reductase (DIM6/NTAB) family NADH-FMN oxidoreductase RutF
MNTDSLVTSFEAGMIDGAEFPHEAHVQVAAELARRYGPEEGYRRLSVGLRGIAARAGRPDAYHETITRAWFALIAGAGDVAEHPELLDRTLLGRYYSQGRLAAGRETWLEPDMHPLALPPPAQRAVDLESVLRRIPTVVAVLATRAAHTVHATTVGSTTAVSRTPPLVSVCLANGSRTLGLVSEARTFALSFLSADQADVAAHFAGAARPAGHEQFAAAPHRMTPYGPVLDAGIAWLGCDVREVHPCGDHSIVVGEVGLADAAGDAHPLLRYAGAFR